MTAPQSGDAGTPEENNSSGATPFHFQDKRRIDPETGEVRNPQPAAGGAADHSIDHLDFDAPADLAGGGSADLAAAQAKAAELLDDLQRERASFTNYRNRALRDQEAARTRGIEDVLVGLLPVLDDIDRARQHGGLEGPLAAIADKLEASLTKFGIERYGEVGEVFDPTVHEALMHRSSPDATEITVEHVLEPGYRIGEKVVRPARVAAIGPQD